MYVCVTPGVISYVLQVVLSSKSLAFERLCSRVTMAPKVVPWQKGEAAVHGNTMLTSFFARPAPQPTRGRPRKDSERRGRPPTTTNASMPMEPVSLASFTSFLL